jgi:hypothetical protein
MNAYIVYIKVYSILGPSCVEDQPHITHGLSFALGTHLSIGFGLYPCSLIGPRDNSYLIVMDLDVFWAFSRSRTKILT